MSHLRSGFVFLGRGSAGGMLCGRTLESGEFGRPVLVLGEIRGLVSGVYEVLVRSPR